jgi:hypothetical protein
LQQVCFDEKKSGVLIMKFQKACFMAHLFTTAALSSGAAVSLIHRFVAARTQHCSKVEIGSFFIVLLHPWPRPFKKQRKKLPDFHDSFLKFFILIYLNIRNKRSGDVGDRTRGLPYAKQTLYH